MRGPTPPADEYIRRHVAVPGILAETLEKRWEEFRYPGFSPYALELMCFDLRLRCPHTITVHFAGQPPEVQEAIDRLIIRYYQPGPERTGLLMQAARGKILPPPNEATRGTFARFRSHVRISPLLAPCMEIRWRELGYTSLSAYVTGVIRYDLLLLGQHKYYNGDDTDPEMLASMDRGTFAEFEENRPKRLYIYVLLEELAERPLTDGERQEALLKLAAELVAEAVGKKR